MFNHYNTEYNVIINQSINFGTLYIISGLRLSIHVDTRLSTQNIMVFNAAINKIRTGKQNDESKIRDARQVYLKKSGLDSLQ